MGPILLIFLRIVQGFSAGGEWGGAALMAVEHAPDDALGKFGAFPQAGVPDCMLLAFAVSAIIAAVITPEQFNAWGWRIPFLLSFVLILIAYCIRQRVEESPSSRKWPRPSRPSLPRCPRCSASILRRSSRQRWSS
ncbi:MFS transporter [Glutamicibacter mysorens]